MSFEKWISRNGSPVSDGDGIHFVPLTSTQEQQQHSLI